MSGFGSTTARHGPINRGLPLPFNIRPGSPSLSPAWIRVPAEGKERILLPFRPPLSRNKSTTSSDPSPPAWPQEQACFEQRHEPARRQASDGSVQPRQDGLARQDVPSARARQ